MIKPTVGRIVWFYPPSNSQSAGFAPPEAGQPLAAIIASVVDSSATTIVHLTVFDAHGVPHQMPYVQLVQEREQAPDAGRYATWMPYQIGQAKKTAAACEAIKPDPTQIRVHCLEVALRTPGVNGHRDVLAAARAYQDAIEGAPASAIETKCYSDGTSAAGLAPLPDLSPAEQAVGAPEPLPGFANGDFGDALAALKCGAKVARAGWNGKGLFVYLVPANSYPAQTGAAKSFFGDGGLVPYTAYLAVKNVDDTVSTWAPSCSDALAEDWLIVE